MKSRNLKLGAIVLAAISLITVTGIVAAANNSGYETFKQIVKDTSEEIPTTNAIVEGTMKVSDNGKVLAVVNGKVKGSNDDEKGSGTAQIELNGKKQELSFYKNGENVYLVDETNHHNYKLTNATKSKEFDEKMFSNKTKLHPMGQSGEALIDYFMGDLKTQFESNTNADGSKSITLDLNENEIPIPVKLMVAAAVEGEKFHGTNNETNKVTEDQLIEKFPFIKNFSNVENDMPKLTQDIKLVGVYLKLNFDAKNTLTSFETKVQVNGKDEAGTTHSVLLEGNVSITNKGTTVADTFNPEGKNVETIDASSFKKTR